METYFARTKSGQWFQFTATESRGDAIIRMFEKLGNPVVAWTTGVQDFERSYNLKAASIPSLTA